MPRKKWVDVDIEKLATEVIGRNGKFHIMIAFMGIALMPAVVTDRNGRLIYMNKRAEVYWGMKTTNVIGQNFAEQVMHLNLKDSLRVQRESKMVLAGGEPRVFYECHEGVTDKPIRQSVLKFPFGDDDDDVLLGAFILPHAV